MYQSRWANLGSNSGNMKKHRIVKSDVIQYNGGKFNNINIVKRPNTNGTIGYKATMGLAFTGITTSDNNPEIQALVNASVFGIGTNEPFSRISLGSNKGDGLFDNSKTKGGQNAAIALHENCDGKQFKGFVYDEKIIQQIQTNPDEQNNIDYATSIGIFTNKDVAFSLNDSNISDGVKTGGRIYVTDDDRLVVGGKPRVGLEKGQTVLTEYDDIKVKLDVQGSIRTQGYINFINYSDNNPPQTSEGAYDGWLNKVDNKANLASRNSSNIGARRDNIPKGSIWMGLDTEFEFDNNVTLTSNQPKLYFKDSNGNIQVIKTSQESTQFFNGRLTFNSLESENTFSYLFNLPSIKPTKITLSGEPFTADINSNSDPVGFNNTLTIRTGNAAIVGSDGSNYGVEPIDDTYHQDYRLKNDTIGGNLWIERQLGIGYNKSNKIYSILDMETIEGVPAIISTKTFNEYDIEPADEDSQPKFFMDGDVAKVEFKCTESLSEKEKVYISPINFPEQSVKSSNFLKGNHIVTSITGQPDMYEFNVTTNIEIFVEDESFITKSDNDSLWNIPLSDTTISPDGQTFESYTVVNITGNTPDGFRQGIYWVGDYNDGTNVLQVQVNYGNTAADKLSLPITTGSKIRRYNFNFQPNKATNSIILLDGLSEIKSEDIGEIGLTHDARNCFLFGAVQKVNAPNSIIGGNSTNTVTGEHGESIVVGSGNHIGKANNVFVFGKKNKIDDASDLQMVIGNNIGTNDDAKAFVVHKNGNIGMGKLQPTHSLHIEGVLKLDGITRPGVNMKKGGNEPDDGTKDGAAAYFWHQEFVGATVSGYNFQVRTGTQEVDGVVAMTVDENQNVLLENDLTVKGNLNIHDNILELAHAVGSGAVLEVIHDGTKITKINVTNGGSNYNPNNKPPIIFTNMSVQPDINIVINDDKILRIEINTDGGGEVTNAAESVTAAVETFKQAGILMNRNDIPSNIFMGWDEIQDKFIMGKTTGLGSDKTISISEVGTLCVNLISSNITYKGTLIEATGAEINYLIGARSNIQDQIDAEAATRLVADVTEAATRLAADTTLQNNIDAEAAARLAADTTLQNNIDAEAATRLADDTTLQNNIDAEAATRLADDTTLQNNIDAEAASRLSADVAEAATRFSQIKPLKDKLDKYPDPTPTTNDITGNENEFLQINSSGTLVTTTKISSSHLPPGWEDGLVSKFSNTFFQESSGKINLSKKSYKNSIGYVGDASAQHWKVTKVPTAGFPYGTTETGPHIIDGTYTPPTPPGGLPYGLNWSSITISDEGSVMAATTLKPKSTDPTRGTAARDGGKIWISTNAGNTWSDTLYSKTIDARGPYSSTEYITVRDAPVLAYLPSMDWKDIDSSGDGTMMAAVVHGGRIWRRDAGGGSWRELRDDDAYGSQGMFDSWWQNIIVSQDGTRFMAVESGTGGEWNYSSTAFGNVGGDVYTPISRIGNVAGGGGFWRHPSPSGYPSGNNDTFSDTQWSVSYAGEGPANDGSNWAGLTGTDDLATVWAIEGLNIWKSSEIKWTAGDAAANGAAASGVGGAPVADAYTLPAIIWTKTSPTSTSVGAFSGISGNLDGLAACVDGGNIYTSIDGTTWKEQIVGGGAKDWKGISRSGKMLVACEGGNVKEKRAIWISSDGGITWTILEKFGAIPWMCISLAKNSMRMAAGAALSESVIPGSGSDNTSNLYLASGGGSFGDDSTTIGYLPTASGEKAIAMGITTNASGYGSIALGNYSVAAGPLSVAIGNRAYAGPDVAFAIGADGTTASALAEASMNNNALIVYKTRNVKVNGSVTAYQHIRSSDNRIKSNEGPIVNARSIISQLNLKQYIKTPSKLYNTDHVFELHPDTKVPLDPTSSEPLEYLKDYIIEIGIIAQEIKDIPELEFVVHGDEATNTPLSVDYNSIHCTHIAATQEIDKKLTAAEEKISAEAATRLSADVAEAATRFSQIKLLKAQLTAAEEKISALETDNATLKTELIGIETRLAELED